jgi:HlyD family secretion protein
MKKRIVYLLILALIAAGIIFYIAARSAKPMVPQTVNVTKGTIISKAQAVGYIKPAHSNSVKSPVDGKVVAIYHYEGEYVKKNDPLVTIEPQPDPTLYATTYSQLQEAIAVEKSAFHNLERYEKALQTRLITWNYSDYITAKKDYDTAHEQRILAAQKLAILESGIIKVGTKTIANVVYSPIDGYVLLRNIDIGDSVISLSSAQSATDLFIMANMSDLKFDGSVDETDASKIHLGMPATITIGASNQKITGIISKIALQSEQENAKAPSGPTLDTNLPFNISFKVEIANLKIPPNTVLRSGYSATADIPILQAKDTLTLPERVLHFRDDKVFVLLPPKKKTDKPIERVVTIGLTDGINAEITSGLKLNDVVLDQPEETATNTQ